MKAFIAEVGTIIVLAGIEARLRANEAGCDGELYEHAPEDIRALIDEVTDLRMKLEAAQFQIEEVTGVQGEHYPCKPDIFEATYEGTGQWVS